MSSQPVVYAIADTHLGLRERGRRPHSDSPASVADFFRWLHSLPKEGRELAVLRNGSIETHRFQPPTHLILLGDILELWDAENQNILLSSASVTDELSAVPARKIYVLGNHDNVLERASGVYPFGIPELEIVKWIYPKGREESGPIEALSSGDRSYLFVHGHQMDVHFRRSAGFWRSLGHVRQFGAAVGRHAWWFLAVTLGTLAIQVLVDASLLGWVIVAFSALLWIPRAYMTVARPIWAALSGRRYRRSATLKAFRSFWKGLRQRVVAAPSIGIVYGHTHILDYIDVATHAGEDGGRENSQTRLVAFLLKFRRRPRTLFNISSWISTTGPREAIIWATIFYADEQGPVFLGWDWNAKRPFHIPFEFVEKRRADSPLDSGDAALAAQLDWPVKLIQKWSKTKEKVR